MGQAPTCVYIWGRQGHIRHNFFLSSRMESTNNYKIQAERGSGVIATDSVLALRWGKEKISASFILNLSVYSLQLGGGMCFFLL